MHITAHIISHTHWDREWFLSSKYTDEWLIPFFNSLFNLMNKYPDYCFVLDGQTLMIEDYLHQLSKIERIEAKKKFKKYVSQSRLLIGPYYLQPDWRLVSGESLLRNIIIGHQMAQKLGKVMKVGWLLDNFGQISQAPQIHKGFDIDGVYLWRGIEVTPGHFHSEYFWKSPDGSQVTSVYLLNSYRNAMRLAENSDIAQERIVSEVRKLSCFATTNNILLMNGYDQEMVPDDVLPLIRKVNADLKDIQLLQTTPEKYLKAVQKENPSLLTLKGTQNNGRYISVFPGTLSTRMYLKQMNRQCENQLIKWAEPMSSLLWAFGGEYPQQLMDFAWKKLLKNHPHDNICGVSIDDVHSDMEVRFKQSQEASEKIISQTLKTISDNIDTQHDQNLVVFNPSPWKRDGIVKVALKVKDDFSICEVDTNKPIPYQIGRKRGELTDVYFFVSSVPAVGYKTYYIHNEQVDVSLPGMVTVSLKDYTMENKHIKVKIKSNGSIIVIDKETGCQYNAIAYFEDGADSGDTYNYSFPPEDTIITSLDSKARITLIEQGPLVAMFKIELSMDIPIALVKNRKRRSKITRRFPIVTFVSLEVNSPRVDFHTQLKNVTKDHRLRVVFPTFAGAKYSTSDRPFDVVDTPISFSPYPTRLPYNIKQIMIGARESVPVTTLPLNSFVYLNDENRGAGLITLGLSEYEIIEEHKIALALFRAIGWLARDDLLTRVGDAGPMIFTPEAQCLRYCDFHYSFMPYHDKTIGFLFKQAELFNTSLKAVSTGKHRGMLENKKGLLWSESDNDGLVISAVKKGENEDKLIIRLFNPLEQEVRGVLTFNGKIQHAEINNLNEELKDESSTKDNSILLKVPAKKIVTLGIKFKKRNLIKNISSSKTKILFPLAFEKENFLDVDIPDIVTKDDIKQEQQRADQLQKKLSCSQNKMEKIEKEILSNKNKRRLAKFKREKIRIWGVVTALARAELEARLSLILTQKKYIELYESDYQKKNGKMNKYDSMLREIGLMLNTARITKRVSEYLIQIDSLINQVKS